MLATQTWEDISDECPDPDAIRCFAVGFETKHPITYVFCEYPDEERKYALAGYPRGKKAKLISDDQIKLKWLRERLILADPLSPASS